MSRKLTGAEAQNSSTIEICKLSQERYGSRTYAKDSEGTGRWTVSTSGVKNKVSSHVYHTGLRESTSTCRLLFMRTMKVLPKNREHGGTPEKVLKAEVNGVSVVSNALNQEPIENSGNSRELFRYESLTQESGTHMNDTGTGMVPY